MLAPTGEAFGTQNNNCVRAILDFQVFNGDWTLKNVEYHRENYFFRVLRTEKVGTVPNEIAILYF